MAAPRCPAPARRRRVAALLSGLLLLGAAPATAEPLVAYQRGSELTLVDLDGGQPRVLGGAATQPAWSPDGAQIAYTDATGVWIVPATGGEPELVAADEHAGAVAWSPDGLYLAYDRPSADRSGIVVLTLFDDGFGLPAHELTQPQPGAVDLDPVWAPDGSALSFRRLDLRTGYFDLAVLTIPHEYPEGSYEPSILLDQGTLSPFSAPAWSPGGHDLAFVGVPRSGATAGQRHLYRVGRDGGGLELLVADDGTWAPQRPVYSPDGTRIGYGRSCHADCTQSESEDSSDGGIWVLDLSTRATARIAATAGFEPTASWSHDGLQLAFESVMDDSGCHCPITELYAVAADGTGLRVLDGPFVGPAAPTVSPDVTARAAGATRVETAVAVARAAFTAADTVVIARQDGYADALAGAALAGALDAPVMLAPHGELPDRVIFELRRLGASRVLLLGDESALSDRLEEQARQLVDDVVRLGGATRYATAAVIADELPADHAFVVQGASADPTRGWPDAVAVTGLAGAVEEPLLLVEQDRLPEETAAALERGGYERVTIVGGPQAVSEGVAQQVRDLGIAVDRVAGATRYATSAAVAALAVERGVDDSRVWLATGRNWPDTLSAGPAAAHAGGLLLLVDGTGLDGSPETRDTLAAAGLQRAWIAGGPDVITPTVRVAVERLGA